MLLIDLNCDMGESFGSWTMGNDAELMNYVSSVNIACGYHAGDAATMRMTVEKAIEKGIAIGAHPSYPDLQGFGRRTMSLSPREVFDIVLYQISALKGICEASGGKLYHVKPHGALYNQAAKNTELAKAIAEAIKKLDGDLILYGLSGSVSIAEAQKLGLKTASEVFADRTYQNDGSLTPRTEPNALIKETRTAANQAAQMVMAKSVTTIGGETIPITAETICIHGDGANAVEFAKAIRQKFIDSGIEIAAVNK